MTIMVEQDVTPNTRTHLSDLVRKRREELRLSLREMEARTVPGKSTIPVIKKSWIHRLEKGLPVTPPQLPELKALARALELPLGRLQDAAGAQFLGIDTVWSSSGEARALIEHAERMTPAQREQLARLLATFEQSSPDS